MKLSPQRSEGKLTYPRHSVASVKRRSPWVRRLAVAAGASMAFWLGAGCDDGPWRMGGVVMEPQPDNVCGTQAPGDAPLVSIPGTFESSLCGTEQAAWAKIDLQLNTPLRFAFSYGNETTAMQIIDEDGEIVDELLPEDEAIELTLPPGVFYLSFTSAEGEYNYDWFTVEIDFAP